MFVIQIEVRGEPNPSQPRALQQAALQWISEKYPYAKSLGAIVLIPAHVPDGEV